jgi:histidinol-phosphate/aromatic aminotransferase/cobyric acid decarboxylase-like protein
VNESQANFQYLLFQDNEQKNNVYETLEKDGLMVCDLEIFGQEKSLRITIGQSETNQRIIDCLSQIK